MHVLPIGILRRAAFLSPSMVSSLQDMDGVKSHDVRGLVRSCMGHVMGLSVKENSFKVPVRKNFIIHYLEKSQI